MDESKRLPRSGLCRIDGCEGKILARGYCSKHYDRHRRLGDAEAVIPARDLPFADHFWSRVAKGPPDACWPWTGDTNAGGYGQVSVKRRPQMAHRVALELSGTEIPKGMFGLHRCDNPPCCNPAHLYVGTARQNSGDRDQRGRARPELVSQTRIARGVAKGERNPRARLTRTQVDVIRQRYALGNASQQQLADEFRVNQTLVSLIVRNKIWT